MNWPRFGPHIFKEYLTPEYGEAIPQDVLPEAGIVYAELHGDGETKDTGARSELVGGACTTCLP